MQQQRGMHGLARRPAAGIRVGCVPCRHAEPPREMRLGPVRLARKGSV
jgi:hypothetical protein